jgi:hypothetical protein
VKTYRLPAVAVALEEGTSQRQNITPPGTSSVRVAQLRMLQALRKVADA